VTRIVTYGCAGNPSVREGIVRGGVRWRSAVRYAVISRRRSVRSEVPTPGTAQMRTFWPSGPRISAVSPPRMPSPG